MPDIEQAVRELDALGIPMIRLKILATDGNWQTWIDDPDGHRIELMQMMPDCLLARGIAQMNVKR